jgi:hypothetical protein
MSKPCKLINRSAVRAALKQACKDWGHTKRKNIPRDAIDFIESMTRRAITSIAAEGFKK